MDHIFQAFLKHTAEDTAELQRKTDVVILEPLPPFPPSRYRCTFLVPYLRRLPSGTVDIDVGPVLCEISFPEDYLRSTDPKLFMKIASILNPDFLHPNVLLGSVCLGSAFAPGTPIHALIGELFDIVTYRNCTVDEHDALNPEVCRLVREHRSLVDKLGRRSLYRSDRRIQIAVRPA